MRHTTNVSTPGSLPGSQQTNETKAAPAQRVATLFAPYDTLLLDTADLAPGQARDRPRLATPDPLQNPPHVASPPTEPGGAAGPSAYDPQSSSSPWKATPHPQHKDNKPGLFNPPFLDQTLAPNSRSAISDRPQPKVTSENDSGSRLYSTQHAQAEFRKTPQDAARQQYPQAHSQAIAQHQTCHEPATQEHDLR